MTGQGTARSAVGNLATRMTSERRSDGQAPRYAAAEATRAALLGETNDQRDDDESRSR